MATATLAAAEAAAADDGLSEGIIRIKLIEYHGKAGCDAMGKNAIKNAKRTPSRTASGAKRCWTLVATSGLTGPLRLYRRYIDTAPSIGDSSFCL